MEKKERKLGDFRVGRSADEDHIRQRSEFCIMCCGEYIYPLKRGVGRYCQMYWH